MLYTSNDTLNNLSPVPFVYYHCDCADLKPVILDATNLDDTNTKLVLSSPTEPEQFEEDIKYSIGLQLLSSDASRCLYPLSRLYFCEDCHEIRCPHCVQDEIISYYCPNCLFEVPTASVKGEKNRCARNCFQCPVCQNTLGVNASKDTSSSSHVTAGPYFLACNVCRWNSQEINMLFEKPTGLALQLLKNEDNLPDTQEFDHLKTHFEKNLRINTPPLSGSFLTFPGALRKMVGISRSGGLHSRSSSISYDGHSQQQQIRGLLDDIPSYECHAKVPDMESSTLESLIGLQQADSISTLSQRHTQLYDQPYQMDQIRPQRTHLCIKRSKRCRTCRHVLIKPEPKAQTTRFKIKLVAMNYIPTITIKRLNTSSSTHTQQSLNLSLGVSAQFALKFTNPLYEELTVSLATPSYHELVNGQITILSPHFSVGAYNETVEYDDEMDPLDASITIHPRPTWTHGIYEKKSNYTSILIDVTPHKLGELKFPLWVTCCYKSDEDRMDMSLGDIDQEEMDNSVDGKASSLLRMDDDKMKRYSFWCLIGLGNVAPES